MRQYTAITMLCCSLVFCNTACGAVEQIDEGEVLYPPENYAFTSCADEVHDNVFDITDTEDGMQIVSAYNLHNVCVSTTVGDITCEYLPGTYVWALDGFSVSDIKDIMYDGTFQMSVAECDKVGQVSYRFKNAGEYIFCSATDFIEGCEMENKGIYRMYTDSDVRVIYEVNDNE